MIIFDPFRTKKFIFVGKNKLLQYCIFQWRAVRLLVGEAQFVFKHMSVPQLERCSKGGKSGLWRGQIFWAGLVFTKFSVDLKKKTSSHQVGLLFSEVSVGFQKKNHHLETAARVREVWMGMLGSLGGEIFVQGVAAPFAPPLLVAALTHVCKKII